MHSKDDILRVHYVLLTSSNTTQDIINELYARDSRFQFIQEAISHFHLGDDDELGWLHGSIGLVNNIKESDVSPEILEYFEDGDDSDDIMRNIFAKIWKHTKESNTSLKALDIWGYGDGLLSSFVELLKHDTESNTPPEALVPLEEIWQRHEDASRELNEIICAAIYEIMEAFSIEITVDQIPAFPTVEGHVELLKSLYSFSKKRPILPISSSQSDEQSSRSQETYTYQYTDSLARLSKQNERGKIRVLHLLPGSGRNRISCRLEVQDLRDGIDEALSYVWGKREDPKCIWVDDQPFQITSDLYAILLSLRRPSTTRVLWIDAICINQSDLEEKSHQVRLMGEIYSNARIVTIWLSDQSPGQNLKPDPYNSKAPLPSNFGDMDTDQYDVVPIIEWTTQLLKRNSFERDHLVASVLLLHWINAVMSHEWWERIWTIQEAVLPKKHPKIVLGAYEFSFGDIILAMNMVKRLNNMMPEEPLACVDTQLGPLTHDNNFLLRAFGTQISHYKRLNWTRLVPYLRPGHDDNELHFLANPIRRSIELIICATSHYKATDPRDKYFALKALLRNSKGKLMCTNYNESTETVFRRATARCYNGSSRLEITTTFDLFVEIPQATGSNASTPSWVVDFTYSDAHHHTSLHGDKVTFRGYIRDKENWNPRYNPDIGIGRCFATPKTLFCPGLSIDSILSTRLIPDLSNSEHFDDDKLAEFLTSMTIQDERSYWAKKGWEIYQSRVYGWVVEVIKRQHEQGHRKSDELVNGIVDDLDVPTGDITKLFLLGGGLSLNTEVSSDSRTNSTDRQIQRRVSRLAGKQFFTTKRGLCGISTAPVKEGDTLAVTDASPVYYIFREVKTSNGRSYLAQRHRIVARVVLGESKERMEKRFIGLQPKIFQIV
ncbi:heterokaryon incompatibility protein-domain-containing protein [Xylaria arbuscula]|nr:heterokaryon incompatibility protein-domain-containing protein [Xylaria arbuscula]